MIDFLATAVTFVVPFVLVLTIVVTVHELGHFLAARACGVAVDRFSIGFGRALVSWHDRSGVEWRIGWIPLGGYVRFAGDENEASVPDQEGLEALRREVLAGEGPQGLTRYYHFKPVWQRALIAAAGPAANFLLAITLFAALLMAFGEYRALPKIGTVETGGPAALAGIRTDDLVVEVAGQPVDSFQSLSHIVQLRGGAPTDIVIERRGRRIELTVTPAWAMVEDGLGGMRRAGRIGVGRLPKDSDVVHITYGPSEAAVGGVTKTWGVLRTTVYYLGRIISGQVNADQISGPLGIANLTGKVTQIVAEGAQSPGAMLAAVAVNLLQLIALLSASIGFMNLLPIPVLDGGHLMFYAYEAVARKPLAARVQAAGYRVGLALVLGLMLFATWNDLQQLRVFNILGRLFS